MHGDAEETVGTTRIIEAQRLIEEGEAKCCVVMGSGAELSRAWGANVQAEEAQRREEGNRFSSRIGPMIMQTWTIGASIGKW